MVDRLDSSTLSRLENEHEAGLSSAEILAVLEQHGVKFSEATLRKYVQLGLLPRSVRVGRKGKHQGSQGMYPVSVVRQILRIKRDDGRELTIEQIQREFLFVRGDIEELELDARREIFKTLDARAQRERKAERGRSVGDRATSPVPKPQPKN